MSLAVVTAFGAEYQAVWSQLFQPEPLVKKDEDGYAVTKGSLFEVPVHLMVSGIGKPSVEVHTAKFLERFRPAGVLILGFCGGLSHTAKVGTVSIPDAVIAGGRRFSPPSRLRQRVAKKFYDLNMEFLVGDMSTIDKIIETAEERKKINSSSGAVTVDMEAFYIAEMCEKKSIPWFIMKTVMDDLNTKSFNRDDLKPGLETAKTELLKILPVLIAEARAEWQL